MGCCPVDTLGGAPAGGGGAAAPPNEAMQIIDLPTPPTGTVNTSVVRFDNAMVNRGTVALASWITRTPSATLGDLFTVRAGRYWASWVPVVVGAADFSIGVSLNATGAQLTGAPDGTTPEFEVRVDFAQPTGIRSMRACGIVHITDAMVLAGTNIVRCHASDGGAAPSIFVFVPTLCSFVLRRIGDV